MAITENEKKAILYKEPKKQKEEGVCRHCGRSQKDCYTHCHAVESGVHEPDPLGAYQADQTEFCVDYVCKNCGRTGGVKINPKEIYWE